MAISGGSGGDGLDDNHATGYTDLDAREGYFPNPPNPAVCGHEGTSIIEQGNPHA
jgi:hypothetical protein